MRAVTGETTCQTCGARVLVVLNGDRVVILDAVRSQFGAWEPTTDNRGITTAKYEPRPNGPDYRNGHHAHTLRCEGRLLGTLERSRERIAQRTTEPVYLPVLTPAGVRALVGASS